MTEVNYFFLNFCSYHKSYVQAVVQMDAVLVPVIKYCPTNLYREEGQHEQSNDIWQGVMLVNINKG